MVEEHLREVAFVLDGQKHLAHVRIAQREADGEAHYQAVLADSPLHGTYGGWASSVELALDFLNLAMQAEGAELLPRAA